jgi:ferric iron reductase protein FhuF
MFLARDTIHAMTLAQISNISYFEKKTEKKRKETKLVISFWGKWIAQTLCVPFFSVFLALSVLF